MGSHGITDTPLCNRCLVAPTWAFYVDIDSMWTLHNPTQVCYACRRAELDRGPPAWLLLHAVPAFPPGINMMIASYVHPDIHNIWCRAYLRTMLIGNRTTPFARLLYSVTGITAILRGADGNYGHAEAIDHIIDYFMSRPT